MYKIIKLEDSLDFLQMDDYIRNHQKGHFLQSPRWSKVKTKWLWRGIMVYQKGELSGVLSLLIRRIPFVGAVLYAPRGPVCNRDDWSIMFEFMDAVNKIASEHRALVFYLDPDELDSEPAFRKIMTGMGFREKSHTGFGNLQPQYVFRLNICAASKNSILQKFSPKTRYNIRLAQRKGVKVDIYSGSDEIPDDVLESFSSLMKVTGERDGFPVRGREYFGRLLESMKGDAVLLLASYQGKPIAGAIEIIYGSKAWYLYGASGNDYRETMPNYLLQWHMISYAIDRGCSIYDFRGIPGEPSKEDPLYGLYQFKKGFGGTYTKFSGLYCYIFRPFSYGIFQKLQEMRHSQLNRKS